MIKYFIYFFIVLTLVPAVVYAAPDEFVWAGGEKGSRQVPVYYVETIYCDSFDLHDVGCYDIEYDYITIKAGYRDLWTPRGCTVLQHEQTHAWGFYDEISVGSLFDCDNPNDETDTRGLYDANNFFHFDPRYEWTGYGKLFDPTAYSWFVGERSWNVGEQD